MGHHTQVIDHWSSFGGSVHGQGQEPIPFNNQGKDFKVLLLHGYLNICVKQAVNLPNMDALTKSLGQMFSKLTQKIESKINTSDPYVTVSVSGAVVARTFVIKNNENPAWMQHFSNVPVAHYASEIHFIVKDHDLVGSEVIGAVGVPVEDLVLRKKIEGTFPVLGANGSQCRNGAGLSLSIEYNPIDGMEIDNVGGVPGTYFPLRKGGKVTLYQDAHVEEIGQIGGFEHRSCWSDVFQAISEARRLVYITGWSVNCNVRLVRNGGRMDCTLGELLKAKSQEGVRVLLLVWDDPTSSRILSHKYEVRTIYTHHQKTVIADADAGRNRRKIIAFVGGLDLCNGRYDTQEHSLFRTSHTVHKDDFHNPTLAAPTTAGSCPRQPWHDLHSKIEGPAAYDVLTNFEERWSKASKPRGIHKLRSSSQDDALLKLERIPEILGFSEAAATSLAENDPEAWHVQVFRSIDSTSVKGFPDDPGHCNKQEPAVWEEHPDRHEHPCSLCECNSIRAAFYLH